MPLIEGNQLRLLNRIFGLAGDGISGTTQLDDKGITLVSEVSAIMRRGDTYGVLTGWYQGTLENVHSGADDEVSSIDPYAPGASAVAPYPANVPEGFDIWLLGVGGRRSSGSGGLTAGAASVNPDAVTAGWGQDDGGAALGAIAPRIIVAQFDGLSTINAGFSLPPMITEQGLTYQPVGMRVPRGALMDFHSTAAAAAEFQMSFVIGLYPEGLGQDVVV